MLWENLTSTIVRLKGVATSPSKIKPCLVELRSAEKTARHDLYAWLGVLNNLLRYFTSSNNRTVNWGICGANLSIFF